MPSVVTVARQNHASSAATPPEDAMNNTTATTNVGKPFRRNDNNSSPQSHSHSHSPLPSPHAVVAARTPENETDFTRARRLEKKKKKKLKTSRYEEQVRSSFVARSVISVGNGRESSRYDPHKSVKGSTPRGGVGGDGDGKWKSDATTMRVTKEVPGRRESTSFHEWRSEDERKFSGRKSVSGSAAAAREEQEDGRIDSGGTRGSEREVHGIHPAPEKRTWSGWMTSAVMSAPPRQNEVKVMTGMMMEEQHRRDKQDRQHKRDKQDRKDPGRRDAAKGRRDKKRGDSDGGGREVAGGRVGDGIEGDKRADASDAYRNGMGKVGLTHVRRFSAVSAENPNADKFMSHRHIEITVA